jgi:hypothetical protein
MKTFTSIIIFVIVLLQTNSLNACTCNVDWSFCETVDNSYHIVEVEVISLYVDPNGEYEYMDIKILETLQNGIIEDTLTVFTNYIFCHDLLLGQFNIGDKLVVNFTHTSTDPSSIANYSIIDFYSCHTNVLNLDQNEVSGFISPSLDLQNYDDFKNNLTACNDLIASNEELEELENSIQISPNPFSENITIDFGNLATSKISLEIFSVQGQRITSVQNFHQYNYKLPMSDFPKGIYFVKIQYRNESIIKKIAKL